MLTHGDEEAQMLARILRTYSMHFISYLQFLILLSGLPTQLRIIPQLRADEFDHPGSIATFISQHKYRIARLQNDDSFYLSDQFSGG